MQRFLPTAGALALAGYLAVAPPDAALQTGVRPPVWRADNGDGTYKNPVLFADYSDPDVIRVGRDFYMTASSFNCVPGLPILHSRDLVNWTLIGHALQKQPPPEHYCKPQHGNGVWAPALRYRNGEFYIFYGDPDFGVYMVKARKPEGPWTQPHLLRAAKGWIDPCPFWDDYGNAYLVRAWARSRSGIQSILTLHRMSADGTKLLDEGVTVFDGRVNHPTIEGPKLYKRGAYYYIFAPAGGVRTGWQTVLRSKNIYGPYEDRIVMDQGKTEINGPHQGAWVELVSGESWFVHFQDRGAYGRVTHLQPMRWVDDWPVIGADPDGDGKGEPVPAHKKPNVALRQADTSAGPPVSGPQEGDEFDAQRLSLAWQWHANPQRNWWSLDERRGWLRLRAAPLPESEANLWGAPNLLLQKLPAPAFTVTARMDFSRLAPGERAGVLVMGADYSYLAVERAAEGAQVVRVTAKDADQGSAEAPEGSAALRGATVFLRVTVGAGAQCRFSFSSDGRTFREMGAMFTAREGRWIGAKVGLVALGRTRGAVGGSADFDWVRLEAN